MNQSLGRRSSRSVRPKPHPTPWLKLKRAIRHFLRNPTVQNVLAFIFGACVFLFNLFVLYHFFISPSQSVKPLWHVGTSKIDITPSETVWLSGFASRNRTADSTVPLSPLFVRAVAIRHTGNSNIPYVIVSADVIGLDRVLSDRIYKAAFEEFDLPRERLRICVTHTHSGPVIGENLAPLIPEDAVEQAKILRYSDTFYRSIMKAIRQSLMERVSTTANFGQGKVFLAVNRRQVREREFHGTNRGATEDSVPVLWFTNGKEVVAGLFGYAAHATVLTSNYRYSGDFVGMATLRLEEQGGTWLFLAGCGGDQNVYPRGSPSLAIRYAEILSTSVQKVIDNTAASKLVEGVIARHAFVRLPFQNQYASAELRLRARSKNQVTRRAARRLLDKLGPDGLTASDYRFGIAIWRFNNLTIAFLGGEPTVGYCSTLRNEAVTWVIGYCEDVMGYVGTHDVIADGGREGGERAAWYYGLPAAWNESVEEIIVAGVRANLAQPR